MVFRVLQFHRLQTLIAAAFPLDPPKPSRRSLAIICASIFFLGAGVRLLHWQNNWLTIDHTMDKLAARYKEEAQFLIDGDLSSFIRGRSAQPDTGLLMHTPGYPIVIAMVHTIAGNRSWALRLFHIFCGALAAVLVVLIAMELLPAGAAVVAGIFLAISPQLSYYSLVTLPDSIAALPILLAVYLILRARTGPNQTAIIFAGVAIGVSCWLRANAMLLAPFLCLLIAVLFERSKRFRYMILLVAASVIVIAPITIRNAVVYKSFIPLSLSAGQNLVEGIADYDTDKRFGMESYDHLASQQEAVVHNRPDYAEDLYRPDGIIRERVRVGRAWSVIRRNKLWFLSVMARRSALMLTYEDVSLISAEPSISHRMEITSTSELAWSAAPADLLAMNTTKSAQSLSLKDDVLQIAGDSGPADKLKSPPITVQAKSDYVLRVPVRAEQGHMVIKVVRVDTGKIVASATVPDSLEPTAATSGSLTFAQLPFVNSNANQIAIVVEDTERASATSRINVGRMELFRLGPAAYLWTKYPRIFVKSIQKFFTTRWMLPLALLGVAFLAVARHGKVLAVILAVPLYYLCTHSPLHLELRYALALHHFWAMLVAAALYFISMMGWRLLTRLRSSKLQV
jgi:hypothetical protein